MAFSARNDHTGGNGDGLMVPNGSFAMVCRVWPARARVCVSVTHKCDKTRCKRASTAIIATSSSPSPCCLLLPDVDEISSYRILVSRGEGVCGLEAEEFACPFHLLIWQWVRQVLAAILALLLLFHLNERAFLRFNRSTRLCMQVLCMRVCVCVCTSCFTSERSGHSSDTKCFPDRTTGSGRWKTIGNQIH